MCIKIKKFLLDILFPKFCFNCGQEGDYLCGDCQGMLEISGFHQKYATANLRDLYFSLSYQNPLVRNLIQKLKYEPFIKELAKTLSSLIIAHFELLDNKPDFTDFILIPVPLTKKRLKWRGFNQVKEISRELAQFFKLPLILDCLIKIKETPAQVDLEQEQRKENIKGVFQVQNKELIKNKKILLIDDVYTTGATMEECGRVLKDAGAKEIIAVVVARG